jgi:hypothetical protein
LWRAYLILVEHISDNDDTVTSIDREIWLDVSACLCKNVHGPQRAKPLHKQIIKPIKTGSVLEARTFSQAIFHYHRFRVMKILYAGKNRSSPNCSILKSVIHCIKIH